MWECRKIDAGQHSGSLGGVGNGARWRQNAGRRGGLDMDVPQGRGRRLGIGRKEIRKKM
jgi:hypothetical protein